MVLKIAFDSKIEDFFGWQKNRLMPIFIGEIGGFRRPDGKKTNLAKMVFENRPRVVLANRPIVMGIISNDENILLAL